jgi:hypothetical protein
VSVVESRACSNCGQPLERRARYCVNCGTVVAGADQRPIDAEARVPWRVREAWLIWVSAYAVTYPIGFIQSKDVAVALLVVGNELALLLFVFGWIRWRYGARPAALGFRGLSSTNVLAGIGTGLAGLLAAYAATAAVVTIARAITNKDVKPPEQISLDHPPTVGLLVVIGFAVIVLAPLAEETFFRGFVFHGLRKWTRAAPAIAISAGAFAAAHIFPLVIPPIFVLGVLLARVVERRDSIVPAVIAHAIFNSFGFALFVLGM